MIAQSNAEESDDFDTDQDYGFYDNRILSHELIGVWQPMINSHRIDRECEHLYIHIDEIMLSGTDMACQLYGMMLKHLTRTGWIVMITNEGWIPSEYRVIDHTLATKLARGY